MTDLERLLAEATPGPWRTHMVDDTSIIGPDGTDVATTCDSRNVERSDAYNVEYERMESDARLIALAPSLAAALLVAEKALRPFSEMAGEMFAANWNDDGVAIRFVTKDGPMRITFKEFREARAALSEIEKLTGGGE